MPASQLQERERVDEQAAVGTEGGRPGTSVDVEVGQQLGKLLITDRIGGGAMGVVFRALHQSLGIPVAVKVLRTDDLEFNPQLHEKLKSEARLLAQLNHPNVVRIWDFEDHPQHPYLILDLIEGLTLAELIQQSGRLQPDRAVDIVLQAAEGLAAARRIGVTHRDVKPANILLDKNGHVKLADFGLAVVTNQGLFAKYNNHSNLAAEGTPAYMAPEQFFAPATVDHRSDIYSLGATLYHTVTGRVPFEGRSAREVLFKHAQERVVAPHLIVASLNPSVSEAVERMMAKNPDQRYQNYEELIAALAAIQTVSFPVGQIRAGGSSLEGTGAGSATGKDFAARSSAEISVRPLSSPEFGGPAPGSSLRPGSSADISQSRHLSGVTRLDPIKLLREGIAAAKAGDKTGARALLQRATQLNPRSESAWLWLAGLADRPDDAAHCFERVLEVNPENLHARQGVEAARLQVGIAAAQAGDKEQARAALRAVISHNDRNELAWLWLAGIAESPDEAILHLQRVLEINPHNERARTGLEWHRTQGNAAAVTPEPPLGPPPGPAAVPEELPPLNTRALPAPPPPAPVPAPALDQPCVLVVDDSPTIRALVAMTLKKYGYRVEEAPDGPQALERLAACTPGLILLDINMPGMDGYQVCKAIKAGAATSAIPVVMLSGKDGFFDKLRGKMAGSTKYLTKPFQPDLLVQVVDQYCLRP